jgi:hypothetical protein
VCKFSRPQAVVFLRQWFNLYLVTVCCPSIDLILIFTDQPPFIGPKASPQSD